jgi:hypothetical protein
MRSMTRYATTQTTAPSASSTTPPDELYAVNVVDCVPSSNNTIHGAATANRAALTTRQ